jgi:hypothetical protein
MAIITVLWLLGLGVAGALQCDTDEDYRRTVMKEALKNLEADGSFEVIEVSRGLRLLFLPNTTQ